MKSHNKLLLQAAWFEGFRVRLDQRTTLFVCFVLGGAALLRDPRSSYYHTAIPPQDSPSGHSQLEPT